MYESYRKTNIDENGICRTNKIEKIAYEASRRQRMGTHTNTIMTKTEEDFGNNNLRDA